MTVKRALYLIGTIVAWLLGAFLLLSLILEVVQLTGPQAHDAASGGVGGEITAIVIFALLAALLAWLGLVAEHRFRGLHGAAGGVRRRAHLTTHPASGHASRAFETAGVSQAGRISQTAGASQTGRLSQIASVSHHRHRHPVSVAFGVLIIVGLLVAAPAVTFANLSVYQRSQQTQHHGIHATAVATSVHNTQSCGRYGCHWTAAAPLRLIPPVHGHATTTVHANGRFTFHAGDLVNVLVNPSEPSYAELPGYPLHTAFGWAVPLGFWVLLWGVPAWAVLSSRRRLLKRRRAAPAPSSGTSPLQ